MHVLPSGNKIFEIFSKTLILTQNTKKCQKKNKNKKTKTKNKTKQNKTIKTKRIGARGDIFAYHALDPVPILTKSVKNGQKCPIKWKIWGDKY